MFRAGFEPPPADDTFYEADTLPTKPPRLDRLQIFDFLILSSSKQLLKPADAKLTKSYFLEPTFIGNKM